MKKTHEELKEIGNLNENWVKDTSEKMEKIK